MMGQTKPDAAVLDIDLGGARVTPVALQLKALSVPLCCQCTAALAPVPAFGQGPQLGKPTNMRRLAESVGAITAAIS